MDKNQEDNSSTAQNEGGQKSGSNCARNDDEATELLRAENDGTINSPRRQHGGTSYGNNAGSSTHDSARRKYRWALRGDRKKSKTGAATLGALTRTEQSPTQKNRALIIEKVSPFNERGELSRGVIR